VEPPQRQSPASSTRLALRQRASETHLQCTVPRAHLTLRFIFLEDPVRHLERRTLVKQLPCLEHPALLPAGKFPCPHILAAPGPGMTGIGNWCAPRLLVSQGS